MLPNFFCIGAQKSGTTTLLNQLGRHPDIYMSPARETQFFLLDNLYSHGKLGYEIGFFQGWAGQKAVGEKTPEYLYDAAVPQRMADTLGKDLKFIVAFRSPAQRAYSHYRHNFQQFWENLGFEAALAAEGSRCVAGRYHKLKYSYLDRGRYAGQLQRYLNIFPKVSILPLVYERDIAQGQLETLRRVFAFLGVDSRWTPPEVVSAGRPKPMIPRFIEKPEPVEIDGVTYQAAPGDLLLTRPPMKPRLIKQPSDELVSFARAVIANLPRAESLERADELEMNRRYFSDDIHKLEESIDTDLDFWLK